MKTAETLSDLELAAQGVKNAELEKRIRANAEKVQEEIRQQHGLQTIGAEIIREMRDTR